MPNFQPSSSVNYTGRVRGAPATALVPGNSAGGNLITYSESISNWTYNATYVAITDSGSKFLDGTTIFWDIAEVGTASVLRDIYSSSVTPAIGDVLTASVYFVASETFRVSLFLNTGPWGASTWPAAEFNLTTGAIVSQGNVSDAGIIEVGTLGAQKIYRAFITSIAATVSTATQVYIRLLDSAGAATHAGVPGNSLLATRAQLNKGILSEYLKTTTSTIESSAIVANAFTGTVQYRTDTAPSGSTVFGIISPSYTTDGNVVVNVPYTHSPGNLKSDFILVYYKEGGGTVVASDPAVSTNPATGNLNFTLKPRTTYSFGVQNVRRTESGLVGSSITSSSNFVLSAGNYTDTIKGISASAVVTGGDVGGNLIVRSEDLTTGWALSNLTASPGLLYLDNATTFWKLSESTTTYGLHDAYSSKFNVSPGEVITVSAYVAAAERDIVDIGALYSPWSNAVASRYPQMRFNLTTGAALQSIASPVSDAGITQVGTLPSGQKVYRIYMTTVPANFTTTNGGGLYCRVHQSDSSPQYSGVVGNGAYFTRLQASKNLLSDYIKTTTTAIENTAKTTDAFNETIKYRQDVSPSSDPAGLTVTQTATPDGNIVYKLAYTYSPGSIPADLLIAYVREGGGTISPSVTAFSTNAVTGDISFVLKPNTNYRFGAQAARRTESGLKGGNIISTAIISPTVVSNFTGFIDGSPAQEVRANAAQGATVFTNFNANNDRNNTIPTAPTVSPDTGAVAHVINTDGSADLSFDWQYSPSLNVASANNIDGFIVYVRSSLSSATYTMNTTPAEETTYTVDSARRSFILPGVPANRYYTFGVRAYRSVDSDIDSTGSKVSSIIQPSDVTQNPYLPTANVAFAGNITGTIDGSPASLVRAHASGAFTGTANYRQDVSPSSDPSIGAITQSATADGNVIVKIPFTYSPGSIPADFILVYTKENGGTISPAVQAYPTNPVSGDMSFVLKPSTTYRFGVQAVRRTESGLKGGNILSSADIGLTSPNYTGLIAGVPSNTVTTVVSNFNSSNDRNGISPTAPTLTNTIADYSPIILNSDGTCDIKFNWSYTNGSPLAANNVDGFIVYVQSFNYPNNYTFTGSETSSVIPVANTSSYGYTFKNLPAHQWHDMAVRAYRVVDSDIASPSTLYSNFTSSTYNNSSGITSTAKFPIGQKTHISSSSPTWDNVIPNDDYIAGAGWVRLNSNVIQSTTELAPDGKTFAYELQDSGGTSPDINHSIYRAITPVQGKYFVYKGFVKRKGSDRGMNIRFGTNAFAGGLRNFQFEISPLSMTFPTTGAGHGAIRPLENGWYEFFTAYPVTSPNSTNISFMITRNGSIAYSGTSPDGLYFANLAAYNVDGIIGVSPGLPSVMDVVGSTWYDTTTSSLKIWNGSRWIESSTVGATFGSNTSNITGLSGDGINRVLSRYSGGFDSTEYDIINDSNKYVTFPATKTSPGIKFASISVGTPADAGDKQVASGFYGTKAIKITSDGTGTHTVYFSTSSTTYNMPIDPNSRWILSAKMWTGSPTPTPLPLPVTMGVLTAVSPNTGYSITSPISSIKTWTDLSGVLNLTNDSSTSGLLFTTIGNTNGSPTVWFDGLMLEKQVGPGTTPSKWVKSSQSGAGSSAINPNKIGGGALFSSVNMNQGDGNLRSIVNGLLLGYARDGDVISFSPGYATAPTIIWLPGAKVTATGIPSDASATYEAINVTTTGFTSKLKLTGLAPTVSPVTETYGSGGAVNTVISPSGGGANISADYVINKGNTASEAWDDKYTYNYTVSVTNSGPDSEGIYIPGKITINGYARIASGWVQVFTNVVSGSFVAPSSLKSVSTTFTLDGVIQSPTAGQYEFAIDKGFNSEDVGGGPTAFSSVTYNIAGAVTQISATSANSALVPYLVTATGTGN